MPNESVNLLQASTAIIAALFSLNIWFIRSLTIKIDESWNAMRDFRKDIEHLNQKIDSLSDISKKVFLLEKTVAVLQFMATKCSDDKKETNMEEVFRALDQ
jgi:hypothetical protein